MSHNIVVVGASAGGVEALSALLEYLPDDLPAAILITLHLSPFSESHLPQILARVTRIPVKHPENQEPLRQGSVYVAPPDFHLILEPEVIRLGHGPKENRHRPAIDVMFRSAAKTHGSRVTGVLLTGNLDDGVAGLVNIKKCGGITIVQDPKEASFPEMPLRAIESLEVDWCLSLKEIGRKLIELMTEPKGDERVKKKSTGLPNQSPEVIAEAPKNGPPVPLTCPECQGPLWEVRNGKLVNSRCLVGHRYSLESLMAGHSEEIEQALWVALRSLEERVTMQRRLSEDARQRNNTIAAASFADRANKNTAHAELLRKILEERSAQ